MTIGEGRIDLGTLLDTRRNGLCRDWPLDVAHAPMGDGREPVSGGLFDGRFNRTLPALLEGRAENPW